MIVAAVTVHAKNGLFLISGGFEFTLVLGVGALTVAFTGPGALSLDAIIGYMPAGAAWGVGAAAVAVLGAIAQIAQRVSTIAEHPHADAATSANQPATECAHSQARFLGREHADNAHDRA
jgi:hypothetical protein